MKPFTGKLHVNLGTCSTSTSCGGDCRAPTGRSAYDEADHWVGHRGPGRARYSRYGSRRGPDTTTDTGTEAINRAGLVLRPTQCWRELARTLIAAADEWDAMAADGLDD